MHKADLKDYIDDDDLFQELSLVWLNCDKHYKPNTEVKFSTYLWYALSNAVLKLKQKYYARPLMFSLDYDMSYTHSPFTLSDILLDTQTDVEREIEEEELLQFLLTHEYGWLVGHLLNGKTHQYIANKYNIDRSGITRRINKMIKDSKEFLK